MISEVHEGTAPQDLPKKKPKTSFDLGAGEDLCFLTPRSFKYWPCMSESSQLNLLSSFMKKA